MSNPCSPQCLLGFGANCYAARSRIARLCELVHLEAEGRSPATDYTAYVRNATTGIKPIPTPPLPKPRVALGTPHCPDCQQKKKQG